MADAEKNGKLTRFRTKGPSWEQNGEFGRCVSWGFGRYISFIYPGNVKLPLTPISSSSNTQPLKHQGAKI